MTVYSKYIYSLFSNISTFKKKKVGIMLRKPNLLKQMSILPI